MADSVDAGSPALDCSSDSNFYEPLVGLRLGALFGILAVSSLGGIYLQYFSRTCLLLPLHGPASNVLGGLAR